MLKKFIKIQNVGRFRNCAAQGDIEFKRMSLIFGGNGRGKTTLTAILRSLQSGMPGYVLERATLGQKDKPHVEILLDGTTAVFNDKGWDQTLPELEIFDSEFVHNNVYAGQYVTHSHKRNLNNVVLGEESVRLANHIANLDKLSRTLSTLINELASQLKDAIIDKLSVDEFVSLQRIPDLEARVLRKKSEVAMLRRALEVQQQRDFTEVIAPAVPTQAVQLLAHSAEHDHQAAEARVLAHVKAHLDESGVAWLGQGMTYLATAPRCPFCGLATSPSQLIADYREFFNEARRASSVELTTAIQDISCKFSDEAILAIQEVSARNSQLQNFWAAVCQFQLPHVDFEAVKSVIRSLRSSLIAHLQRKLHSPHEALAIGADLQGAIDQYQIILQGIAAFNLAIEATNAQIELSKQTTKVGDLPSAEKELTRLQNIPVRFTDKINAMCEQYSSARTKKATCETDKAKARTELSTKTASIINAYGARINRYLQMFNAGFQISTIEQSFAGGRPSASFDIVINATRVPVGDADTPVGTPCFRNTLSAGDKSALALSFFLSRLDQDADITKKIVVFDDPMSSQDRFRQQCTLEQLIRIASLASQEIVLSHEPAFLRSLAEKILPTDLRMLEVRRKADTSVIQPWKPEGALELDYFHNHRVVAAFAKDQATAETWSAIRCIRPLLEGNLRHRFPQTLPPGKWLGDFIDAVREAPAGDELEKLQLVLPEFIAINDYTKNFHHSDPAKPLTAPDPDELQAYAQRTLKLLSGLG